MNDPTFTKIASQFHTRTNDESTLDDEDSWGDMTDDDAEDEVDDATFEMFCPIPHGDNDGHPVVPARANDNGNPFVRRVDDDGHPVVTTRRPVVPRGDDEDEDDEVAEFVGMNVPTANIIPSLLDGTTKTKTGNKNKKQCTIKDAWENNITIDAKRRNKSRSTKQYLFVHSSLYCHKCSAYGESRIVVGDNDYFLECQRTKWFDTEFICSFVTLLAHDAHVELPKYSKGTNQVMMIDCFYPRGVVHPPNVLSYDNRCTHFLLVAYSSSHFAVLDFDILLRTVSIFDGLNLKIDRWQDHVVHTVRQYGLTPLGIEPMITYSVDVTINKSSRQRIEVQFGEQAPWIVTNTNYLRQKDGHNCGPIACTKVMEVLGYIPEGSIEEMGARPGGWRRLVMNTFADLLSKYDEQLHVNMIEDGNNVGGGVQKAAEETTAKQVLLRQEVVPSQEPVCICTDTTSKDTVYCLPCCGRLVHVQCLVQYFYSIPFCMFCSANLFEYADKLPTEALKRPSSSISKSLNCTDVNDLIADDTGMMLCREVGTDTSTNEEQGMTQSPRVEGGGSSNEDEDDTLGEASTIEDVNRNKARELKRKRQALSAEKEMKRRGDCLVAAGLGPGAVLTLKVDYRTHSHAQGLVVVVYKSNVTGSALVCCESGVVTHDGSKGDYWVPSDKFIVSAGAGEMAAIPSSLQKIRDAVVKGEYDYGAQPRISYSKLHAEVSGASSPCKKATCGCKGGICGNRCGCRRKKMDCHSSCACSGNCNPKKEDEGVE